MIIKRKYNIIKSKTGFKYFIRHSVGGAERFIECYKRFPLFSKENLEEYIGSLHIVDIKNNLINKLNRDQLEVLSYFRYHNPIDVKPSNYDKILNIIYLIWLRLLPKDDLKINPVVLGRTMKIIRTENNLSIISLSLIMGVDRNTITQYEKGERLPSLEYFYRFCWKFNLNSNDVISF